MKSPKMFNRYIRIIMCLPGYVSYITFTLLLRIYHLQSNDYLMFAIFFSSIHRKAYMLVLYVHLPKGKKNMHTLTSFVERER